MNCFYSRNILQGGGNLVVFGKTSVCHEMQNSQFLFSDLNYHEEYYN